MTATDAGAGKGSGQEVERPFDTIEHEHPFDVKPRIERVFAPGPTGV